MTGAYEVILGPAAMRDDSELARLPAAAARPAIRPVLLGNADDLPGVLREFLRETLFYSGYV